MGRHLQAIDPELGAKRPRIDSPTLGSPLPFRGDRQLSSVRKQQPIEISSSYLQLQAVVGLNLCCVIKLPLPASDATNQLLQLDLADGSDKAALLRHCSRFHKSQRSPIAVIAGSRWYSIFPRLAGLRVGGSQPIAVIDPPEYRKEKLGIIGPGKTILSRVQIFGRTLCGPVSLISPFQAHGLQNLPHGHLVVIWVIRSPKDTR
ncbi:hypothetical protein B0H66DRAFT_29322 [Apodospora peruviana]|uniref:Uncharacterized protein n=1 Tax=Apodospora peruviana TaxID=516989 RepID=A0AAE0IQT8_9PEZI|nr:hypothetical protein B0H66DRAFT_29322 [Apodospora peruviana]